jgi:hypothetical protein
MKAQRMAAADEFAGLFTPFKIRGVTLPNRIVMPAMPVNSTWSASAVPSSPNPIGRIICVPANCTSSSRITTKFCRICARHCAPPRPMRRIHNMNFVFRETRHDSM